MLGKDDSGRIMVSFRYDPQFVAKIKTIEGRKWPPEEKYWSFPDSDGTLEKILKVFEGEEIRIDPALQAEISSSPIRQNPTLAKPSHFPTLEKGGEGGFSDKNNSTIVIEHNFEDLQKELVSRRYSYKTVKGYLYYNRDFLKFSGKSPSDINDADIKNYLYYLAEERQSATSTLNQAINALKFYPALLQKCWVYYGTMLKKKFLYEIKRPRKDKKLPVILSKPRTL